MTLPVPHALQAGILRDRHGFFTRRGGLSTGPYASLNCSLSGQDQRDLVLQNRALAARAVGAEPHHLLGLHQVHGTACVEVRDLWQPGAGPRADAMVTRRPGLALGIITADCAPVLFADRDAGIVGAAHAGWRGAVGGVLEATVAAMRALGATRIAAAVGPCIGPASYEVAADLRTAVLAHSVEGDEFLAPGHRPGHWQFDLPGYCAHRLSRSGVQTVTVIAADTCALEHDFFSHRRRTLVGGGAIGHQISIILA